MFEGPTPRGQEKAAKNSLGHVETTPFLGVKGGD